MQTNDATTLTEVEAFKQPTPAVEAFTQPTPAESMSPANERADQAYMQASAPRSPGNVDFPGLNSAEGGAHDDPPKGATANLEGRPYRFVRASQWLVHGLLKHHYLPYWPVNVSDVFAAVHVATRQVVAATLCDSACVTRRAIKPRIFKFPGT